MKLTYRNHTIEIIQDSDPSNPREDDNMGKMYCLHKRYNLGDSHKLSLEELNDLTTSEDVAIWLPLYLYDHSGITMSIKPFSCAWDSGQVGIIYATHEDLKREGIDLEQARNNLESEVKTYDQFLTGDIYGYKISKQDEELDSCWGFYGQEDCLAEAKSLVDYYEDKGTKQLELTL